MKITVWGINYAPELTGIGPYNTALCEYLRDRGHDVRMVSTFPYYPAWRKRASDRFTLYRTEDLKGVPVHRCWHYVPRRARTLTRILHEGSFVLTSFLRQLALPRADVLVVVSPPLLLGAAAWLLGRLKRTPYVFHVQDLQPDAAAGLGMVKSRGLLRGLRALERFAYRQAARVSGITPGMLRSFGQKGVEAQRQCYFPNPVVIPDRSQFPPRGRFRQRLGAAPDDFLVVYSGNLGVKQGLDTLIEAARHLQETRIRLVLCGDGNRREHLARLVSRQQRAQVVMLGLQPEDQYREMLVDADLCVIPQQAGSGGCFFPSKLLQTLALARPVLTVADATSELVTALNEGGFGINVEPGEPRRIAAAIEALAQYPTQLRKFGEAGRTYVERYELSRVLGQFDEVLQHVTGTSRARLLPLPAPASIPPASASEADRQQAA